ncbi:MAG: hypothetical protein ACK4K9_03145 [Bacteroidia bacterium]
MYAQYKINQGKVTFDITYKNLPAMLQLQQEALPKQQVLYFKDSFIRIESGIGGKTKNITIQNIYNGNIYVLLEIYNKKFALIKHDSDLQALKTEMGLDTMVKDLQVQILDSISRTIAGYTCKKAIVTKKVNGILNKNEIWFTTQLPPVNKQNNDDFKNIPGFLLQYTMNEAGINTTFKAREILPLNLEPNLFKIPPEYDIVTEEQLVRLLNYYKSQLKDFD